MNKVAKKAKNTATASAPTDRKMISTILGSQFDFRRAAATFILGRLGDFGYMRMLLQELPQRFAQDSHAAAMHDPHSHRSRQECVVHKLLHRPRGFIDGLADDVDLGRYCVVLARQGHADS